MNEYSVIVENKTVIGEKEPNHSKENLEREFFHLCTQAWSRLQSALSTTSEKFHIINDVSQRAIVLNWFNRAIDSLANERPLIMDSINYRPRIYFE
ncbi:11934_t:CDS:1, partial [Dentiscutata heterogama]